MTANSLFPGAQSSATSASLLERVQAGDESSWTKLAHLYGPVVHRWARQAGLQPEDAQDVVQNVFLAVASDVRRFRREPDGGFRGWLWTICRHKILDHFRTREHQALALGGTSAHDRIQQLPVPERGPEETVDERRRLRHRALELLRDRFEPRVWQAFHRTVVHGDHPADVARDLGLSIATVYRVKARVLAALRSELEGLQ